MNTKSKYVTETDKVMNDKFVENLRGSVNK